MAKGKGKGSKSDAAKGGFAGNIHRGCPPKK